MPQASLRVQNLTLGTKRPGFVPAEGGSQAWAGAARAHRGGPAARQRRLQLDRAAFGRVAVDLLVAVHARARQREVQQIGRECRAPPGDVRITQVARSTGSPSV